MLEELILLVINLQLALSETESSIKAFRVFDSEPMLLTRES
jgi:hypothetical protein